MRAAYSIAEPFDVDHPDELAGITPAQAFVLGVEWAECIRRLDDAPRPFVLTIHRANETRLRRACRRRGRSCAVKVIDATWAEFSVGAKEAN